MRKYFDVSEIPDHLKGYFCPGQNTHVTVKNTALMKYFAKLICPPGGIILDPFGGSGSTAIGAIKAGMGYVLIEQDPGYVEIAQQRINAIAPNTIQPQPKTEPPSEGQLSLL